MISEGYFLQNVNIVVCIHQAQLLITVKLYNINIIYCINDNNYAFLIFIILYHNLYILI